MSLSLAKYSVFLFSVLASESSLDSTRPFLDKLREKKDATVKESGFEFPFLISQTAVGTGLSVTDAATKVRVALQQGALPIRGSFPPPGSASYKQGRESLPVPPVVRQDRQLEAIKECTAEKCLMKLHTAQEKTVMQKSADKLGTYHQLVLDRIGAYTTKRELLGYEDRDSNQEFVRKMLPNLPFLKHRYPAVQKFFNDDFWEKKKPPASLNGSFLRQEVVIIAPERLQPIWRIGEVFELREANGHLFVELHLYSNHYFDSSLRVYEIISVADKSILVITDIIEVDELTKSGLIRMLYRGKMESAVSTVQSEDVQRILN